MAAISFEKTGGFRYNFRVVDSQKSPTIDTLQVNFLELVRQGRLLFLPAARQQREAASLE